MGEKLFYRPLTEEDTDALVSLWGDYEVIKYTGIKNSRARKHGKRTILYLLFLKKICYILF